MKNRNVIVTGANSGIGKTAAITFAKNGFTVIMACRNLKKSEPVRTEISGYAENNEIHLMELDMSSFSSIRKFAAEFSAKFSKLDILIHNAAYFNHGITEYQMNEDGVELAFATNTFGPYLLNQLLLPLLKKSDDARILLAGTTNILNFLDPKREIEYDNLRGEFKDSRKYSTYKLYGDSKMGLLLLTHKMAEQYKEFGISVNGIMIPATKLDTSSLQKVSPGFRIIARLQQPFSVPQQHIANCYFYICTSMDTKNITGAYFDKLNRILIPKNTAKLSIWHNIKELINTRHTPWYANNPENIEKMWKLASEIIPEGEPA